MNVKFARLLIALSLVWQAPNAMSLGLELRGGAGLFVDNQERLEKADQGELIDAAAGVEFNIGDQAYLVELELNTTEMQTAGYNAYKDPSSNSLPTEHVEWKKIDTRSMARLNLMNIRSLNKRLSVYYGISILGAEVTHSKIEYAFGNMVNMDKDSYIGWYFGLNAQLDYEVFSLGGLSIHAYANPFNYYYKVGFSSDVGLKLKYSF
ncbi:hypothetical protein [Marinicellulosiphila megalodicopiae]|uniref:hypothetical protein n=1 Tax=Marinicellulosiphila megalodicopiae TaxID=2724896 RepID=UPI003BB0450D